MGNVKISAFSSQSDLSLIEGLAGYEGTVGNYTNARISGTQLQSWLQANLTFATATGTINTLAMFTGANAVGDSIVNQFTPTSGTTVLQVAGSSSSGSIVNIANNSTRSTALGASTQWTTGTGFTDFFGIVGSSGSSSGSTNWTNTGVKGTAVSSQTNNTGVRGYGGDANATANNGTNYGGHFTAKNGDNNYALRLEDGTETVSTTRFLKCVTAGGEANWADLPATVGSLIMGSAASSTGAPLTVTNVGDDYQLNPFTYDGTSNIGFVPTGGTSTKFLTGDGSWSSPDLNCLQFPPGGTDADPMISTMVDGVTQGFVRIVGGNNINVNRTSDDALEISSSGGGTVTSVGLSMPTAFSVANSPVTTSGTLTVTTTGGASGQFLAHDGTWATPTDTTYSAATASVLGLIKVGFTTAGNNYAVQLDGTDNAFVNVPWTDNNTTYDIRITQNQGGSDDDPDFTLGSTNPTGADKIQFKGTDPIEVTRSTDNIAIWSINNFSGTDPGAVPDASGADAGSFLRSDGTWAIPSGSGTVTSVGLTMPTAFTVTGSPVTGAGTLAVSVTGGAAGEFLNHLGDWSTPTGTTYTGSTGITVNVSDQISITNTGVTAGQYGDALKVPQITVNDQGQLTSVSEVTITAGGGGLTPTTKTASYTAVADDFIICNVSGTLEITLPSTSLSVGDIVGVKYASQNAQTDILRVKTNASTILIDGVDRNTNPLPVPAVNTYFEFIYGAANNWYIK